MNNKLAQDIERQHFDALAQEKGEIWWGSTTPAGIKRLERRAKIVKEKLSRYKEPKVFELGCGTGAFTKYILEALPDLDLTACDISSKCIKIATQRYASFKNAKFLVKDITSNALDLGKFNAIVGNSVLHHLPIKESIKYCYDLLQPEGSLIFFEPNMLNPQIALEKNIHFIGKILQNTDNETAFIRWNLKNNLLDIGFKQVNVTPFDFLHPGVPSNYMNFFDKISMRLESLPILRELSGSLLITAVKTSIVTKAVT